MTVCSPLLNTTNRVSLKDAIVGEGRGDPDIGQLCHVLINSLTKTQQFDRFLNRFGRCCDEPARYDQENQNPVHLPVILAADIRSSALVVHPATTIVAV